MASIREIERATVVDLSPFKVRIVNTTVEAVVNYVVDTSVAYALTNEVLVAKVDRLVIVLGKVMAPGAAVSATFDDLAVTDDLTVGGDILVTGTVDGVDVSALAASFASHHHDAAYVNVGGDSMSGTLAVTGDVTATALVRGADLEATDDLTVGDDAGITGTLTVGAGADITGVTRVLGASGALRLVDRDGTGDWDLFHNAGLFKINNGSDRLTLEADGDLIVSKDLTISGTDIYMENASAIRAKDSGGTYRVAIHPRWSDDWLYLDGGNGILFRVANGGTSMLAMRSSPQQIEVNFNGSASAPAFARGSDLNTGIYWPNADDIRISSGGADALFGISGQAGINASFTTANTTTVRHQGFGLLAMPTSTIDIKDLIQELDGDLADKVLAKLRPVQFVYKPFPDDTPEVAALRALDPQVGFVAEWMAELDADTEVPFSLAEYEVVAEEGAPFEAWDRRPSYWKEPHVTTLLVAAYNRLSERVADLEGKRG